MLCVLPMKRGQWKVAGVAFTTPLSLVTTLLHRPSLIYEGMARFTQTQQTFCGVNCKGKLWDISRSRYFGHHLEFWKYNYCSRRGFYKGILWWLVVVSQTCFFYLFWYVYIFKKCCQALPRNPTRGKSRHTDIQQRWQVQAKAKHKLWRLV